MVRVLDSRAGHAEFESRSVLIFLLSIYVVLLSKNFIFKQDLDLEPVKVNSTTSRVMCRLHKDIFFHFYQFMVWSISFAHRHYG